MLGVFSRLANGVRASFESSENTPVSGMSVIASCIEFADRRSQRAMPVNTTYAGDITVPPRSRAQRQEIGADDYFTQTWATWRKICLYHLRDPDCQYRPPPYTQHISFMRFVCTFGGAFYPPGAQNVRTLLKARFGEFATARIITIINARRRGKTLGLAAGIVSMSSAYPILWHFFDKAAGYNEGLAKYILRYCGACGIPFLKVPGGAPLMQINHSLLDCFGTSTAAAKVRLFSIILSVRQTITKFARPVISHPPRSLFFVQ